MSAAVSSSDGHDAQCVDRPSYVHCAGPNTRQPTAAVGILHRDCSCKAVTHLLPGLAWVLRAARSRAARGVHGVRVPARECRVADEPAVDVLNVHRVAVDPVLRNVVVEQTLRRRDRATDRVYCACVSEQEKALLQSEKACLSMRCCCQMEERQSEVIRAIKQQSEVIRAISSEHSPCGLRGPHRPWSWRSGGRTGCRCA